MEPVPVERAVLVVDDDVITRSTLRREFLRNGWLVHTAAGCAEALAVARAAAPFDLVVADLRLPDGSGLDLVEALATAAPIVVMTSFASVPIAVEAMRLGAVNFVTKPASAEDLLAAAQPDPRAPQPSLARREWAYIQEVLRQTGGNVSEAARRLGIPRRTLQRKLRKAPPSH